MPPDALPIELHEQIDAACDRLEEAWQRGAEPRIEEYLAGFDVKLQTVLLRELLLVELAFRRERGEQPSAGEYAARFPQAAQEIAALFAPRPADQASVTLSILSGPHQGERRVFTSHQTVVVGRGVDATWQLLQDPYFSRYQFRIETNPPQCRLVDLESSNGTSVNGRRVQEVQLQHGDKIECGSTVFDVAIVGPPSLSDQATLALQSVGGERRSASIPQRLADFEITRELGRGAMGVVYHALHRPSGREAAIKLIEPEIAVRPEAMQLFLREAHILSQLRHERIVEYLSLGMFQGRMYIAMEYLPAIKISELLASQSRPRQIRLACGLACYMLEALQYAHERDIVHRDIKPSNVLVYKVGKKVALKLADFGLAKNFLNAGFSSITREDQVRGTLPFMAPEQLINCRYARPACDIYGVGACLYHFLSGQTPHAGLDQPHAIARLLNSSPRPLAEVAHDLPLELTSLVDRALSRDPAQRFATAEQMRRALQGLLDH